MRIAAKTKASFLPLPRALLAVQPFARSPLLPSWRFSSRRFLRLETLLTRSTGRGRVLEPRSTTRPDLTFVMLSVHCDSNAIVPMGVTVEIWRATEEKRRGSLSRVNGSLIDGGTTAALRHRGSAYANSTVHKRYAPLREPTVNANVFIATMILGETFSPVAVSSRQREGVSRAASKI